MFAINDLECDLVDHRTVNKMIDEISRIIVSHWTNCISRATTKRCCNLWRKLNSLDVLITWIVTFWKNSSVYFCFDCKTMTVRFHRSRQKWNQSKTSSKLEMRLENLGRNPPCWIVSGSDKIMATLHPRRRRIIMFVSTSRLVRVMAGDTVETWLSRTQHAPGP